MARRLLAVASGKPSASILSSISVSESILYPSQPLFGSPTPLNGVWGPGPGTRGPGPGPPPHTQTVLWGDHIRSSESHFPVDSKFCCLLLLLLHSSDQERTYLRLALNVGTLHYSVVLGPDCTASMKNAVFWDVTSCGSCKNGRFGGTSRLRLVRELRRMNCID
jgi:hypothetical protein